MSELLNCPFCGGADIQHETFGENSQGYQCQDCGVACRYSRHTSVTDDFLRAKWNRRANVSAAGGAEAVAADEPTVVVPVGESRWLIERTATQILNDYDYELTDIPPERHFWSGAGWSTSALFGARYPTKAAAESTIASEFLKDAPIEACEHLFQCGVPELPRDKINEKCCGERDATGTCFAPACSQGEALRAYDEILTAFSEQPNYAKSSEWVMSIVATLDRVVSRLRAIGGA